MPRRARAGSAAPNGRCRTARSPIWSWWRRANRPAYRCSWSMRATAVWRASGWRRSIRRAITRSLRLTARKPRRLGPPGRAGRRCGACSIARRSCSLSSKSAAPLRAWRPPRPMRRSGTHSADRSARSRRSSTSSRMFTSPTSWPAPMLITAPGRLGPMPPTYRSPPRRRACRRARRSSWRPRRTSRRMAGSASPGTWTATCSIAAPSCWGSRWEARGIGRIGW